MFVLRESSNSGLMHLKPTRSLCRINTDKKLLYIRKKHLRKQGKRGQNMQVKRTYTCLMHIYFKSEGSNELTCQLFIQIFSKFNMHL